MEKIRIMHCRLCVQTPFIPLGPIRLSRAIAAESSANYDGGNGLPPQTDPATCRQTTIRVDSRAIGKSQIFCESHHSMRLRRSL